VARVMTSGTVKTIEMVTMGNPQPSPNSPNRDMDAVQRPYGDGSLVVIM